MRRQFFEMLDGGSTDFNETRRGRLGEDQAAERAGRPGSGRDRASRSGGKGTAAGESTAEIAASQK